MSRGLTASTIFIHSRCSRELMSQRPRFALSPISSSFASNPFLEYPDPSSGAGMVSEASSRRLSEVFVCDELPLDATSTFPVAPVAEYPCSSSGSPSCHLPTPYPTAAAESATAAITMTVRLFLLVSIAIILDCGMPRTCHLHWVLSGNALIFDAETSWCGAAAWEIAYFVERRIDVGLLREMR